MRNARTILAIAAATLLSVTANVNADERRGEHERGRPEHRAEHDRRHDGYRGDASHWARNRGRHESHRYRFKSDRHDRGHHYAYGRPRHVRRYVYDHRHYRPPPPRYYGYAPRRRPYRYRCDRHGWHDSFGLSLWLDGIAVSYYEH